MFSEKNVPDSSDIFSKSKNELEPDFDIDFRKTTMTDELEIAIEESGNKHLAQSGFLGEKELIEFGVACEGETIFNIFERVSNSIRRIEEDFSDAETADSLVNNLTKMMMDKKFIPSSPTLMNADRECKAPLSACAVPKVNLDGDFARVEEVIEYFHMSGMGTGFNFDSLSDPIPTIEQLNRLGIEGHSSGKDKRPVGNMGVLSINHDKLMPFINIKKGRLDEKWVFNFSVLIDNDNLAQIIEGGNIVSMNGEEIPSSVLIEEIAKSIHADGEPGLVLIDRLNESNQAPNTGEYKTLAPCAEVGLIEGETCQFSYINLGEFINGDQVDYPALEMTIRTVVRFLDNAVEYNIKHFTDQLSRDVSIARRKVGLGVCGFADLLAKLRVDYCSDDARKLAENLFSFINFISKIESMELAKERGAFGAFKESKYMSSENIIQTYSNIPTETVSREMWLELGEEIKKHGLRNCSTIAIPPTSRSSLIIGASPSIEPYFDEMLEIPPTEQLMMIDSIQKFTDESISKTINVPESTTVEEIKQILMMALKMNLKGITIFRDQSREYQPEKVNK